VVYSQGVVRVNDTTFYLITHSEAVTVILLDAYATELERENELLNERIHLRDSTIQALTVIRESQTAIDTAQNEIIDRRGERIEVGKKEEARLKRQAVWESVKGAWKEITVGVTCAGIGYGVGYVTSH
jgi:hypothetical protein